MKKLDLHMHSKYSDDGQYEPTELLKMCKAAGPVSYTHLGRAFYKYLYTCRKQAEKRLDNFHIGQWNQNGESYAGIICGFIAEGD